MFFEGSCILLLLDIHQIFKHFKFYTIDMHASKKFVP